MIIILFFFLVDVGVSKWILFYNANIKSTVIRPVSMLLFQTKESSIEIADLIYHAYAKFGDITNQHIDKLRLKYRLKVVQVNIKRLVYFV